MLFPRQILLATVLLLCTTSFTPPVTASPVNGHTLPDTHTHSVHWGYSGDEGPNNWGTLSEEYRTCKEGLHQSPVDLAAKRVKRTQTGAPTYHWNAVSSTEVVHNGHTIQISIPHGPTLSWGGETYDLLQFHMHTPAEHQVNGQSDDMELHLVSKSASGKFLVSGVMFKLGETQDPFLRSFNQLPTKSGENGATMNVNLPLLFAEVDHFQDHWEYSGSLTTPPCTEGVQWIVAAKELKIGQALLSQLQSALNKNARPVMVTA